MLTIAALLVPAPATSAVFEGRFSIPRGLRLESCISVTEVHAEPAGAAGGHLGTAPVCKHRAGSHPRASWLTADKASSLGSVIWAVAVATDDHGRLPELRP